VRPPGAEGHDRVDSLNVGPTRGHRVNALVSGLAEEDPVLAPGVGVADQLEASAGQGMERVGDEEFRRIVVTGCS
jgi:hypothetical protein